jgi:biotin operon repressor
MSKSIMNDTSTAITATRATRLYKLLTLLDGSTRARTTLLKKLNIDIRSFYRDVELIRELGIVVESQGDRYRLVSTLDSALDLLPFPDPGLSFRDVMQLSQGAKTVSQKKLRTRLSEVTRNGQGTA